MDNILISIVIPSLNQGAYIENAILSVLKQDYQNWELVIQDCNSTDDTASICEHYTSSDSRISFYSEEDTGYADAINKALSKCRGDFVGIQSSDDFYATKDVFSEVNQIYRRHPFLKMISGYAVFVDPLQFRQVLTPYHPQDNGFIRPNTVFTLNNTFSQGAMFFSRTRALEVNGLDSSVDMVADTDFWVRMANYRPVALNKIFRTSRVWACVTIHENQRSNHYNRFYLGRAKMAINHFKDSNIDLDDRFKFQHALNMLNTAFDFYGSLGIKTNDIETLYQNFTGETMALKKVPESLVSRLLKLIKHSSRSKTINTSMDHLKHPFGSGLKWF